MEFPGRHCARKVAVAAGTRMVFIDVLVAMIVVVVVVKVVVVDVIVCIACQRFELRNDCNAGSDLQGAGGSIPGLAPSQ